LDGRLVEDNFFEVVDRGECTVVGGHWLSYWRSVRTDQADLPIYIPGSPGMPPPSPI
jgi:NADH:ubiquinone oxidoreductase subunit B-like Fe-S oxidoreductase